MSATEDEKKVAVVECRQRRSKIFILRIFLKKCMGDFENIKSQDKPVLNNATINDDIK